MKSVLLQTKDGAQVQYDPNLAGLDPWGTMSCMRCGVCCSRWQAPCSRKEMSLIAQCMNISLSTFIRRYTKKYPFKRGEYLLNHNQQGCIFLKYDNGLATCQIHDVEPDACRNWTPSMSKSECRHGLRERDGKMHLPVALYPEGGELNQFPTCLSTEK